VVDCAIILAGGIGSRLRPLTDNTPKPLLPIQGRSILEYNIELVKKYGVKKVVLAVGHLAENIKTYFDSHPVPEVKIVYSIEEVPRGTAGAVKLAEKYFSKTFIMMNGDELKDVDVKKVLETHKKNHALATIALTRVTDVSQFGVVELDGEKIVRFVEKPSKADAPSDLINSGFYILEPSVLKLIPAGESVSMEKVVFPLLAQKKKLFGCHFDGQWLPTDTIERYEQAVREWRGLS
jgi:mannose-1-phosphate guanylyltransferase